MQSLRILFVTSEAHPVMKTGGLGDVGGALPAALAALGHDVRVIMPAYRDSVARAGSLAMKGEAGLPGTSPQLILGGTLPGTPAGARVQLYMVDAPAYFDRPGNPYTGPDGQDWPDNAERFTAFCQAAAAVAMDNAWLEWRPDIVHCNDWQSGLVPALLSLQRPRPATVFTIHNLAYQGLFPAKTFARLGLPPSLWSMHGLEFYEQLSFIKGGLAYADRLTTVSPTYAREILTPESGCGMDGLLRERADRLTGILNGADYDVWDPARDEYLATPYSAGRLQGKAANKAALQRELGLPVSPAVPLIGMVGRMVEQKGIDLLLHILPELLNRDMQLVIVGTGQRQYEEALAAIAAKHSHRCHVHIGFNEALAHHVEAGADMFLMPSRFEPCGLNQLYSLRYGTVPIVRRTGGLADTVINVTHETLVAGRATGFVFDAPHPAALLEAVYRALTLYLQPAAWRRVMQNGMTQDFGWERSARAYVDIYHRACAEVD